METINLVASLIGSVGFPIVCCGALWYMINNELKEVRKALNNNTEVMAKLLLKLEAKND